MDTLTLLLLAPFVLVTEGVIVGYAAAHITGQRPSTEAVRKVIGTLYQNPFGVAALVALWALITAVAFVYEFFIALIVMYGLLFTGGRVFGWIGLIVFGVLFISTPGLCGWAILRVGREVRSSGKPTFAGVGHAGPAMPSP